MKYVKTICGILSTMVLVLLVIAVAALVGPRLFGVEVRAIVSGSMAPNYNVGDMVYSVPTEFAEIEEGDVISYVLNEELTVVTHRVVEIDYENRQFYTQGDANNTRDGAPVSYENVLGVVRLSVPYVGRVVMLLEDPTYRILAITAVAVLILLSIIIMINTGGSDEEELEAVQEVPGPAGQETAVAKDPPEQSEEAEPGAAEAEPGKPPQEIAAAQALSEKSAEVVEKLKAWESQLSEQQRELEEKEQKLNRYYKIYPVEEDDTSFTGRIKGLFRRDETLFARIAVLIVILLALANFTLALLSQRTDNIVNNFSLGEVPIEIDEGDTDPKEVEWGDNNKPVKIKNTGTVDAVVRVLIIPEFYDKESGDHLGGNLAVLAAPTGKELELGDIVLYFHESFTGNESDNWIFNPADGYFYYNKVLKPGTTTEQLLSGVDLNDGVDKAEYEEIQVEIQVYADSIQAYGGAAQEWNCTVNEGTGEVTLQ